MKKKILCLALCALMIAACFIGCGDKSKEELMNQIGEETSKGAVTLTMYILAEDKVSEIQEALVEDAVNEIVDHYNIKLDLKYFTKDKYYTTLEKNLAKMKTYYDNKENLNKETEAPVYTDDNGLPTTYYPPNEEFQVDIFYFSGYDKYKKYTDAKYLADFSPEIINNASTLKSGISSVLYENVKFVNGKYDMMPINAEVGEYTYMLINKKVLDSTNYAASQITSLTSKECADLLSMVKKYYPEYVPLYSSEGVITFENVKFFGTDASGIASDDFSLLAGTYNGSWTYGKANEYPAMSGVSKVENNGSGTVIDQIKVFKEYEFNGYYATEEEADKPFAVGYVKGGFDVIEKYGEDYEVVVLDTPTLTTDEFYEGVYAISSKTKSLSASARVLAELYTNEKLINILAHGIEGQNYIWKNSEILDKNDNPYRVIQKQAKDDRYVYNIDPYKLANVAYIYPTVDDDPARSEKILEQNSDAKSDLTLGFTLYGATVKEGKKDVAIDLSPMAKIAEKSKTVYDKILAAKDKTELDAAIAEIDTMLESEEVKAVLEGKIAAYYMKWLTEKKIYVAPAQTA